MSPTAGDGEMKGPKEGGARARTIGVWLPWTLLFLLILCLLGLWWKREEILPLLCQAMIEERLADCRRQLEGLRSGPARRGEEMPTPKPSDAQRQWTEVTGATPRWPEDLSSPQDCEAVQEDLLAICWVLDSRAYVRARGPAGGSFALLEKAVEDLASHPPVASGESLTSETVLANAFHLFRNLGSSRMDLMRDILSREEGLAEPGSMALYRWLVTREQCAGERVLITSRVLYDYAAYLLNTLGGQGYLRRRSPKLAGLSMFYALLILDQGIQKGIDPYGVDIRPHIIICRGLIGSQELVFRDQYLSALQEMEKRLGTE